MTYSYSHYSGAGNSFFFFDNRNTSFPVFTVPEICQKNGIDGVIFLETSSHADYKMRLFNPDGSEAEMCGNGLRCFVKYLQELGLFQETYSIETLAGIHHAWVVEEQVCVRMCAPTNQKWYIAKDLHYLNTGVPHAVLFVDSVENVNISVEGPKLRFHPLFLPAGANANFVSLDGKNSLTVRTYERGVERETLACGTGAVASALAAAHCFSFSSPVEVSVRSKEKLKIFFNSDFSKIEMQGPVRRLQQGCFSLNAEFSIMPTS